MVHCKDCKYWETHTDSYRRSWTTCERAAFVDKFEHVILDGFACYATASDDTGLDSGVKTGPFFSCIHGITA